MKKVEEVIGEMLVELDNNYAAYQRYYEYFYGEEDKSAKHIHQTKVNLCKNILERLRKS